MASDLEVKQLRAELAEVKRMLADRPAVAGDATPTVFGLTRDQIRARKVKLQELTHKKDGKARYYLGDEPAEIKGVYHDRHSVVTVDEDHEPSHKWHAVDAKGRPIDVDAPEADPEAERDAEIIAAELEEEEGSPSDEEVDDEAAPTPPAKPAKSGKKAAKAKRPSDEEVA
jgi:hypothetical protein